jgi:putative ABC transport system permease protein
VFTDRARWNHPVLQHPVRFDLVLGTAGAIGATRLVEGMLFQVNATDPVTFAGVTGFFLVVALGACMLPAWRALRVDPLEALRVE